MTVRAETDGTGMHGMDTLLQDLRFGRRNLAKSPGFTVTAILSLALGIGAATALFSVIYGVILRPFPYVQPEDTVQLWG